MTDRIAWVHVSDFHFRADGDLLSQDVATDALLSDVAARLDGTCPAFALVTGDIAFSGRADEYQRAAAFMTRLSAAIDVPPNRFYLIPGNHDVDRTISHLHYVGARTELSSEIDVDRILGSPADVVPLLDRQSMFWQFYQEFSGSQGRRPTANGLGYVAKIPVGGFSVGLIAANSSWLSGRDHEEMSLLVGERQIIEAIEVVREFESLFVLSMAHHPIEWMCEWDQAICRSRLLNESDFFHRGHLHNPEVTLSAAPEAPCVSIAAGSSHSTRFYGNSYNLVEVDLGTGHCTIRTFRYDPNSGRYEAWTHSDASIRLRGVLPGTPSSLSDVISSLVSCSPERSMYIAMLLHGHREEIPVRLDGQVQSVVPRVGRVLAGDAVQPAEAVLRLRNLLLLYDSAVPLERRIADHAEVIRDFVGYLDSVSSADSLVGARAGGDADLRSRLAKSDALPHSRAFLQQLRSQEHWTQIEVFAPSLLDSDDRRLARLARASLAEALMRSDDASKRAEGSRLADEANSSAEAVVSDSIRAAAAAEATGQPPKAIAIATAALERWPTDGELQHYARGLATRSGSSQLRAKIEWALGGQS